MNPIKKFNEEKLFFEYGVDGIRLQPWNGTNIPFGGAYCIVRPNSESLQHINSPEDEVEMFICLQGNAEVIIDNAVYSISQGDVVYLNQGTSHYINNSNDAPFHLYALWWNSETISDYKNILEY